ncbi:MAG: hypothetical protein AMXMBFR53_13810 [Gemmatimonadota bacterium]
MAPRDASGVRAPTGLAELCRALGTLAEPPTEAHARLAELLELPPPADASEHTTLFLLNLYPYASVHLGPDGMLGGEARDRVAGFWRAVGLTPPAEPDHLGALLGLLAALEEREDDAPGEAERALVAQARSALLREHLLPWVPAFLARVEELGGTFHEAWARLLREALAEEARREDGREAPVAPLPLHLREAEHLPDPRIGDESAGEAFLRALLAPVRSGMILARHDLARAGRELGLGVRMGERAYVLRALLAQDAPRTLAWLAGEARRQEAVLRSLPNDAEITAFWQDRAHAAAALLDELASTEADRCWTPSEATPHPPTETPHA